MCCNVKSVQYHLVLNEHILCLVGRIVYDHVIIALLLLVNGGDPSWYQELSYQMNSNSMFLYHAFINSISNLNLPAWMVVFSVIYWWLNNISYHKLFPFPLFIFSRYHHAKFVVSVSDTLDVTVHTWYPIATKSHSIVHSVNRDSSTTTTYATTTLHT